MSTCFHCLSPIPEHVHIEGQINGKTEHFCCHGCLGVAQWVNESGLDQYYRVRDSAPKADNIQLSQYTTFNLPEIYQKYTYLLADGYHQMDLSVEGIHCAACMWLIEKSLLQVPGVRLAEGNATTFTLHVEWDNQHSQIADLLTAIARLGYQPLLNRDEGQQDRYQRLRRSSLKRLALAGLGMMQVMMYSAGLYAGAWQGMTPTMTAFFQWVSFFLTTPIFFYSGFPFLQSAVQALKAKHLNMDVPVAIAITLAYVFSVYHLLRGSGEIFFDSVVMFVFFLSASRYLEMMGRYKALIRTAQNTAVLPDIVAKASENSLSTAVTHVPLDSLQVDDILLVRAGEIIPVDGVVLAGQSTVSEALLTGESLPIDKKVDSQLFAGSINQEQTLLVRASAVGQQTTLAETKRLLSGAQTQKPRVQQLTDRIAAYIVAFILLSTSLSFIIWHWVLGADNAFEIALSVLVATCPCALSLAVPTAYAAVSNMLANQRLFIKDNTVIDRIPSVNHMVFDKTGTLTTDQMQLLKTTLFTDVSETTVLAIAAALEQHIHHPVAKAFMPYQLPNISADEQTIISGKGVQARIDGKIYTLGKSTFIAEICQQALDEEGIYLCCDQTLLARFNLSDETNPYVDAMFADLDREKINLSIASGDNEQRVAALAEQLGIASYRAGQLPKDKLNWVKQLQADHQQVMMVGDGINDAPVLAAADVSLAVGGASALSQSQADIVLLNQDLRKIPLLLKLANKTRHIIRQNIIWAIIYNLIAVPFALMGFLPPWLAALGMSLSSLVVLSNALRIYWIK